MGKPSPTVFSAADVRSHNTPESCWLIIRGKVYDVTNLLDKHPGGGSIILDVAGEDCTDDFEAVGHTEQAWEDAKQYYIGELETTPSSVPEKPASSNMTTKLAIGAVVAAVGIAALYAYRRNKH